MERRITNPWSWQEAFAFVHAHETTGAQKVLYCAGQLATDDEGRPLHAGDIRAQLNLAFDNLEKVLQAGGYSLGDVVRLNYYTTDVDGLIANWDVIGSEFGGEMVRPRATHPAGASYGRSIFRPASSNTPATKQRRRPE